MELNARYAMWKVNIQYVCAALTCVSVYSSQQYNITSIPSPWANSAREVRENVNKCLVVKTEVGEIEIGSSCLF